MPKPLTIDTEPFIEAAAQLLADVLAQSDEPIKAEAVSVALDTRELAGSPGGIYIGIVVDGHLRPLAGIRLSEEAHHRIQAAIGRGDGRGVH